MVVVGATVVDVDAGTVDVVVAGIVVVVVTGTVVVVVDVVVTTTSLWATFTVAAKIKASSSRPPMYGFPLLTEPRSACNVISENVPENLTEPHPADAVAPYPFDVVLQLAVGFFDTNSIRFEPTNRRFFCPKRVRVTPGFITWNSVQLVVFPLFEEL